MPTNLPYWIPAYYMGNSPSEYNAALFPAIKTIGVYFPQNPSQLHPLIKQIGPTMQGFDAQAQATVWAGLRNFENIIDVKFTPSSNGSDPGVINYVKTPLKSGAAGEGYATKSYGPGAVLIEPGYAAPGSTGEGWLLAHETMHALGLDHPYEGTHKIQPQDNGSLWTGVSSNSTDTRVVPPGFLDQVGFSPQVLDIAALQYLYGPSKSVRTGNDTYKLVENDANFIWDAIGNDTIDGQHLTKGITLDLNPGGWGHIGAKDTFITAPGQVTVNYGSTIENVLGTNFADVITGNSANNVLKGFGGNDIFKLATGNDTVDGGTGIDTVVLNGVRGAYAASKAGETVRLTSAADGAKALTSVERVLFNKGTDATAYDIANGGFAGDTIKLLAVAAGTAMVANKDIAGVGIAFRDAGMTRDEVSDAAINAVVGPTGSNMDVVDVLLFNLTGVHHSRADMQPYVDLLDQGVFTRGSLTSLAADALDANVGLTGVASYDYIPFVV